MWYVLGKCEQLRLWRGLPLQALLHWWHGLPRFPIWWSHRDLLLHGLNLWWDMLRFGFNRMLLFKVRLELKDLEYTSLQHWVLPNCCNISTPWIVCTQRWGMVNRGGKTGWHHAASSGVSLVCELCPANRCGHKLVLWSIMWEVGWEPSSQSTNLNTMTNTIQIQLHTSTSWCWTCVRCTLRISWAHVFFRTQVRS